MSREYIDVAAGVDAPRALMLSCCDCGDRFVVTVGEQRFLAELNYSMPKRCRPCRKLKQQANDTRRVPRRARHWGV